METLLAHSAGNARNSEGSFEKLADGTLIFAYTRYSGDDSGDHASADICLLRSRDGGMTWGEEEIAVRNDAQNVMSVSLLRLQDGRIAMTFLKKSLLMNPDQIACRPYIVFSSDETKSWSRPVDITGSAPVYLTLNNDRLIQLKNGRLILPLAFLRGTSSGKFAQGIGVFYYSDDGGAAWSEAPSCCYPPNPSRASKGLLEPGLIELEEDHLMCWFRTTDGCQYKSFSYDNGLNWTPAVPAVEFRSPDSPLSMKRNPETGELYAIWNDYHPSRSIRFEPNDENCWTAGRTPLVLARSSDNGKTWTGHTILEDSPRHGFAYTAMYFNGADLLLAYCCGGRPTCRNMLQDLKIRSLKWRELL